MKHLWRLFLGWLRWKWEARRERRLGAREEGSGETAALGVTKPPADDGTVGAASPETVESHETTVVNEASGSHDTAAEWEEFESDPRMQARFRAAWLKHERAKARGEVP